MTEIKGKNNRMSVDGIPISGDTSSNTLLKVSGLDPQKSSPELEHTTDNMLANSMTKSHNPGQIVKSGTKDVLNNDMQTLSFSLSTMGKKTTEDSKIEVEQIEERLVEHLKFNFGISSPETSNRIKKIVCQLQKSNHNFEVLLGEFFKSLTPKEIS